VKVRPGHPGQEKMPFVIGLVTFERTTLLPFASERSTRIIA
jgi:hypothetical protein